MSTKASRGRSKVEQKFERGFSLIELLIVVAIILVIAGIAIPHFLRSKIAANESSAVASLRTINESEVTYAATFGIGYGDLASMNTPAGGCPATGGTSVAACLIDPALGSGTKSGYNITSVALNGAGTVVNPYVSFNDGALPVAVGQTGQRTFCSDESGVIRFDTAGGPVPAACAASSLPPIQ